MGCLVGELEGWEVGLKVGEFVGAGVQTPHIPLEEQEVKVLPKVVVVLENKQVWLRLQYLDSH